jgi:SAM-dependent methyltransferase
MDERFSREELPFSPASERNRVPILEALEPRLSGPGRLLEIGSGTGQHAVYMAPRFPELEWLPTDRAEVLPGLRSRLALEGSDNLVAARALDVLSDSWPDGRFTAAFSANTSHIMHWNAVCAMLEGVADCLEPGAPFFLYGPFNINGGFTAPSNETFDRDLRRRDPGMGLRDLADLESQAGRHGMSLEERLPMPANNQLLVFRRNRG